MTQPNPETQAKLTIRTQALLNDITKRNYRNAIVHFDTVMTSTMPADKLEEVWSTVQTNVGPFVEKTSERFDSLEASPVVIFTCKFEKASIDMRVVFDGADNVSGLSFVPAAQATEAAPAAAPRKTSQGTLPVQS